MTGRRFPFLAIGVRPVSMTRRLLLWLSLGITALWLAGSAAGAYVMQKEFGEIFDSAMSESAERLMPIILDDLLQRDKPSQPLQMSNPMDPDSDSYLIYQVRDRAGTVLMHSHPEAIKPLPAPLAAGFWQNDRLRIYTMPTADGSLFLQVADSVQHRRAAAFEAGIAMLAPVIGVVPLTMLVTFLIIRRTLKPVEDFRMAIGEKDSGNLAPIDIAILPIELQRIGRSVNLLLARLRSALDAEREFTAHSAHELRTPIAGALAQTQMLLANLQDPDIRKRAVQVESALVKLASLAEKLLQLARADAGIGTVTEPRDLIPVLDLTVEEFRRQVVPASRLVYERPPQAKLLRPVNPDAYGIVIRNMIENALRHGRSDQPVHVRLDPDGAVCVINDASPLDEDQLRAIRKRFYRLNHTQPGSGLGLSIIERLANQMNASFTISSPAPGRKDGFLARLALM